MLMRIGIYYYMIRGFCHGGDNIVVGGETSGEIISARMRKLVIISVIIVVIAFVSAPAWS